MFNVSMNKDIMYIPLAGDDFKVLWLIYITINGKHIVWYIMVDDSVLCGSTYKFIGW